MPTTIKTRRSKPPTKGQSWRGFPRPHRTSQTAPPQTRFHRTSPTPAAKGTSGLIARARATVPRRKPPGKKSPVKGVLSSLGSAKNSPLARKPSKKGIVGVLAGGLGVAAIAKRRRGGDHDDAQTAAPVQPVEASGADPDTTAD
jgi:hypothetical protein